VPIGSLLQVKLDRADKFSGRQYMSEENVYLIWDLKWKKTEGRQGSRNPWHTEGTNFVVEKQ
jgi:hypothetical protein